MSASRADKHACWVPFHPHPPASIGEGTGAQFCTDGRLLEIRGYCDTRASSAELLE